MSPLTEEPSDRPELPNGEEWTLSSTKGGFWGYPEAGNIMVEPPLIKHNDVEGIAEG
jgi:hypothetical protein